MLETLLPWAWVEKTGTMACPSCGEQARVTGSWLEAGVYDHPVLGRYETQGEMIAFDVIACDACKFWQVS